MGYSCTVKASLVLTALQAVIDLEAPHPDKVSNAFPGGFWEIGRENSDGAITGTVWKETGKIYTPAERAAVAASQGHNHPEWVGNPVRKAGGFRINADGTIARFPMIRDAWKVSAVAEAAKEFARIYAPHGYTA